MKILTNVQSVKVGGIVQSISSFLQFLEKNNRADIDVVGVDILRKFTPDNNLRNTRKTTGQVTIISREVLCRRIHDVLLNIKTLKDLEEEYHEIIEIFKQSIEKEKPDLIVLNGTYFIPWCLYLASKSFDIPVLLHYHGIITKETESWDAHSNMLMKKMEQTFDNEVLHYIFPSLLAKKIVETEVFGHKISRGAILPNSIPSHFFEINMKATPRSVGMVGRWTDIKNTRFIMDLAKHNKGKKNPLGLNVVTDVKDISKSDRKELKSVKIYPGMNSIKLGKFYGDMGAVISPSFFESYGNVPQEAVASGTPALVGKNTGIAEVFRNLGLEELVVDFTSVENVYERIRFVSKKRIGKKVRNKMKEEFSSDRVNTKLLSLYTKAST